jgi:hypothetical protein
LAQPLSPHRLAAITYALYGAVYLAGAWLELDASRRVVFWGFVPWWVLFVIGAGLMLGLPWLIARGIGWLSLVLGLLVAGKALYLLWGHGRRLALGVEVRGYDWFFSAVAAAAAIALWRSFLTARAAKRAS